MTAHDIKELRKEKKLTQSEFGKLCGVSGASVSRWEHGVDNPSGGALKILEQLKSGELITANITPLETKLLDQNVAMSNYDNREDFLTASLKYLLIHGDFMPLDAPNPAHHQHSHLRVAEDTPPYVTERKSNIIDPSTEANNSGGNSNTSAS